MHQRLGDWKLASLAWTWSDSRMASIGLAHPKTPVATLTTLAVCFLLAPPLRASDLEEFKVKREAICEFTQKPKVTREGDKITIVFASKGYCDATVAVEDLSAGSRRAPRIIRHLASGVLGKNAPPPFHKNSLKQTIIWDEKDDQGKYADDKEALTVRVSLGLNPRFERTLYWSPKKRISASAIIRAAPEGVYVYDGLGLDHLRLFDHQGDYIRTIYPFAANAADKVRGLRWHGPPHAGRFPLKNGFNQHTLLTSGDNAMPGDKVGSMSGNAASAMAVHDGRIALVKLYLNRLSRDGMTPRLGLGRADRPPLKGPSTHFRMDRYHARAKIARPGPWSAAFSPDGKWLYLSGYHWINMDARYKECLHGVFRLGFKGEAPMELFAGRKERGNQHAGSAADRLRAPTGVACDGKGRVYVADYMNDRIQVFGPDRKLLKTLRAAKPVDVAIHHRTGEICVFSWRLDTGLVQPGPRKLPATVTRLGPLSAPRVMARYPLPLAGYNPTVEWNYVGGYQHRVAVDSWVDPPVIWLVPGEPNAQDASWAQAGIRLLVEKRGKLQVQRDFGAEAARAVVRMQPPPNIRQRLHVNPVTGKLYVFEDVPGGVAKSSREMVEVDPETGKVKIVQLPFDAEDLCFDLNGRAYLRTDKIVARYRADTWREVPWDYGGQREAVAFCGGSAGRAAPVISGLVIPGHRPWCFHEGGMNISPKGHLVVTCWNAKLAAKRTDVQKSALITAGRAYSPLIYPGRVRMGGVHVWNRRGKLLYEDAIPGIGEMFGIGIDRDDALCVLAAPTRVLDGKRYFNRRSATVVKFRPPRGLKFTAQSKRPRILGTGRAPVPVSEATRPKRPPDRANCRLGRAWVQGAEWYYGGVGFAGFNESGSGCSCWNCRFALDYFARSFAPETHRYSAAVLDSNGNLILRVGRYGNVDDGVPLIPQSAIRILLAETRSRCSTPATWPRTQITGSSLPTRGTRGL